MLGQEVTNLKAEVLSTQLEHTDFGAHVVYNVRVTHASSGEVWDLTRRYAEFDALWKVLRRELHGLQFPRRMHNASNTQIEKRKQQLHSFLGAATARRALQPLSNNATEALAGFLQLKEHLADVMKVLCSSHKKKFTSNLLRIG